jgi:hypothetical protein
MEELMRALFTDQPGIEGSRYTVEVDGIAVGSFNTHRDVLAILRSQPENACTIKFNDGVPWIGPDADDLATKIVELKADELPQGGV